MKGDTCIILKGNVIRYCRKKIKAYTKINFLLLFILRLVEMRLGETLTLLFMGFSLCVSDESAKLEGDVMIGGLFKIFEPEEGSCSTTVETASVRDFEAAKWTLNQLNEANYIPGVRIGKLYGYAYLNKNISFHYCITN